MKEGLKEMGEHSRPISYGSGIQTRGPPIQSSQGMMFNQPEQVQNLASTNMLFRNFVNDDILKKIKQIDEMIEATSEMISTKEELNTSYSQNVHQINEIFKNCSAT